MVQTGASFFSGMVFVLVFLNLNLKSNLMETSMTDRLLDCFAKAVREKKGFTEAELSSAYTEFMNRLQSITDGGQPVIVKLRRLRRLEMELEALSNFNGKQMLDSRDMRLQLKVCDRTLIRWRMSGKLPSFKISGKVYFWAFDVYKFLREEYGTTALPEAFEEQEPITIKNSKTNGKSK